MKKLLSTLLVLMICLFPLSATAEPAAAETTETPSAEALGLVPVELAGMGITISLPADWNVLEVTEEDAANGMAASFSNADNTQMLLIYGTLLEQAVTMDELVTGMTEQYGQAQAFNFNGIDTCLFTDTEADMDIAAILNVDGTGMYMFQFYPSSDPEFSELSTAIISSIAPVAVPSTEPAA